MAPTVHTPPINTYVPLATITLSSSASSITFSSISQNYRDLILVSEFNCTVSNYGILQVNGDTGANYSRVQALNSGSGTQSNAYSGETGFFAWQVAPSTSRGNTIFEFLDYQVTDKHKTLLCRSNAPSETTGVFMSAGRWANTAAITSIKLFPASGNFNSGTFSLYGIAG